MKAEMVARLNGINEEFYQNFADSFSHSRHSIQPGVERILGTLPKMGNILDIGCGNGNLAKKWSEAGYQGMYVGVDFSAGLIDAARKEALPTSKAQKIHFYQADICSRDWTRALPETTWDWMFCFAALHHIPGARQRVYLCEQIRGLGSPNTRVWISVWQPLHSERLKKRILDWDVLGIAESDVEAGDVLMDWRAHSDHVKCPAYRYVHIFDDRELEALAHSAGFTVSDHFFSDGKEGNLGLYQLWSL